MEKWLLLFVLVIVFVSCKKLGICDADELSMQRKDEGSESLKIGGYYYGVENGRNSAPVYYLYSNGVFFTSDYVDLDKAQQGTIIIEVTNNFGKKVKSLWGVFQIEGNTVEIERWRARTTGCETTIYEKGSILNDTTFMVTWREHRTKGKVQKEETLILFSIIGNFHRSRIAQMYISSKQWFVHLKVEVEPLFGY